MVDCHPEETLSTVDIVRKNLDWFHSQEFLSSEYSEKLEEIWLSPVTQFPSPTDKQKKIKWQHKTP